MLTPGILRRIFEGSTPTRAGEARRATGAGETDAVGE